MTNTTNTKAQPNEAGVVWADSREGELSIAVRVRPALFSNPGEQYEVWALYRGTHDVAPYTRRFANEADARSYANRLYRNH